MRKISKPAYYHNYCIDSNQILNNTKDHQVFITVVQIRLQQIQDGGRRLENKKIAISQQQIDRPSQNLARLCKMGLLIVPTVKKFEFQKFKMADGRHFGNR